MADYRIDGPHRHPESQLARLRRQLRREQTMKHHAESEAAGLEDELRALVEVAGMRRATTRLKVGADVAGLKGVIGC